MRSWPEPQRLEKLERLRAQGIDPFGERFEVTAQAADIVSHASDREGQTFALAGRIMAIRGHGRAAFADLKDQSGRIQLHLRADVLGPQYGLVELLDIGDIVGVRGHVFHTRRGEVTIEVATLVPLSKALLPLPDKWHGLTDVDLRYRQRYLDMVMSPKVQEVFVARSRIISQIRRFLDERGFLEVETPVMHHVAAGAAARPFVTHHNALDLQLHLRIALELHLKRLLVGGLEKVYELGRVFRNEGISTRHNPEFTMLELYQAYADYGDMMVLVEELLSHLVEAVHGRTSLVYQGETLHFAPPWPRISMVDRLQEMLGIDWLQVPDDAAAREIAARLEVQVASGATRGQVLDAIASERLEPTLRQPCFLIDHPIDISPLAKRRPDRPDAALRFEAFVAGRELANAFSELNDPLEQRRRFEAQLDERRRGNDEAQTLDEDFVRAMEHGMPPAGGLGIGVDRLVMLLTDQPSIRDVILFPLHRPLGSEAEGL